MRLFAIMAAVGTAISLSSCIGSGNASGSENALSPAQKKTLHLVGVTAEISPGVPMKMSDLDRIVGGLKDEIRAEVPHVLAAASGADAPEGLTMKLVFTQYEDGGVAVQFERRSVAIAQIDANVFFVDAHGKAVAQSKVAAYFGTSGDVGSATNISNVEEDFEADVVALLR